MNTTDARMFFIATKQRRHEGLEIIGVFDSYEKAMKAFDMVKRTMKLAKVSLTDVRFNIVSYKLNSLGGK